jgi:hypothetical protein
MEDFKSIDKDSAEATIREYLHEMMLIDSSILNLTTPESLLSGPSFHKIKPHIFEREYVTRVLGIELPLNESYPYSGPVYKHILHEQRLFEDFFSLTNRQIMLLVEQDEEVADDNGSTRWFSGAVKLGKDTQNFAKGLKIMASDPAKTDEFIELVKQEAIEAPLKSIKGFLDSLIKAIEDWGLSMFNKIAEIAKSVRDRLQEGMDKLSGMSGWKQAMAVIFFTVGINWVWGKFKKFMEPAKKHINDINLIVDEEKSSTANESYFYTTSLVSSIFEDDYINELFGSKKDKWAKKAEEIESKENMSNDERAKKKAKDTSKKTNKVASAADAIEGGAAEKIEKGVSGAETAATKAEEAVNADSPGADGLGSKIAKQLGLKNVSKKLIAKVKEVIDWFKNTFFKPMGIVKGFFKKAGSAMTNVATGGVSGLFNSIKQVGKGLGWAIGLVSGPLQQIVSKSEVEKAEDNAGSEKGFWSKAVSKLTGKNKKEETNESLIRQLIRESLV